MVGEDAVYRKSLYIKLNLVVGKRQVGCLFQLVAYIEIMETLNEHSV